MRPLKMHPLRTSTTWNTESIPWNRTLFQKSTLKMKPGAADPHQALQLATTEPLLLQLRRKNVLDFESTLSRKIQAKDYRHRVKALKASYDTVRREGPNAILQLSKDH
jgi:hypothetical protein